MQMCFILEQTSNEWELPDITGPVEARAGEPALNTTELLGNT